MDNMMIMEPIERYVGAYLQYNWGTCLALLLLGIITTPIFHRICISTT